ncbi:MAG: hypothetical protein ACREN5_02235 [Gemmatimonadales bacterium]
MHHLTLSGWARIAGVALLAACSPRPDGSAVDDRLLPDSVTSAAIDVAVRSAAFAGYPQAGDRQRLMLGTCPARCRYGPLVRIEPEGRSWTVPRDSLARGRVVARLINEDPRQGYPKFALGPADTVYWWVDSVPTGRWRSIFKSSRPGARAIVAGLQVDHHATQKWYQALARFVWSDEDEQSWVTCTKNGCCQSDGMAEALRRPE